MLVRLLVGVIVASLLLAQAPAPAGQAAPGQEPAPIRVQVDEVIVPVTVTDEKDRFVNNLDAKDFHIYDQGREQKIVYFSRETQPAGGGGFPARHEQCHAPALEDTSRRRRWSWSST